MIIYEIVYLASNSNPEYELKTDAMLIKAEDRSEAKNIFSLLFPGCAGAILRIKPFIYCESIHKPFDKLEIL